MSKDIVDIKAPHRLDSCDTAELRKFIDDNTMDTDDDPYVENPLQTAVHNAINHSDTPQLEELIKIYGINTADELYCESLIFYVVRSPNTKPDIISWLIEHGADMYFKNGFDDTALHLAARLGYLDVVKVFGSHGMDLDVIGQDDSTALDWAVRYRHDDMAIYLINQGASLDIPDLVFNRSPRDRIYNNKIDKLISLIEEKIL